MLSLRHLVRQLALFMALLAALSLPVAAQASGASACAHGGAQVADHGASGQRGGCCCGLGGGDCAATCCAIPSVTPPIAAAMPMARMALSQAAVAPLISVGLSLDPPPPRRPEQI